MEKPVGTEKIVYSGATGAFFGATVGAVESVWSIPKLGAQLPKLSSQVKHIGARVLIFGTVGGLFATAEYVAESIRQKSDPINAAFGGAVVGLVPGVLAKNARVGAAASIAGAASMAAASYWADDLESPLEKYAKKRATEQS